MKRYGYRRSKRWRKSGRGKNWHIYPSFPLPVKWRRLGTGILIMDEVDHVPLDILEALFKPAVPPPCPTPGFLQ